MAYRKSYMCPSELIHSARSYVRSSELGRNAEYEPQVYIKAKEDGWDTGHTRSTLPGLPLVRMRLATAPQSPSTGAVSPRKPRPPQTARVAVKSPGRRSRTKSKTRDQDKLPDIYVKKKKEKNADADADKEAKRKRKAEREEERQRKEQDAKDKADEKKRKDDEKRNADKQRKEQEKADREEARRKKEESDAMRKQEEEEARVKREKQDKDDAAAAKKKREEEDDAAAKKREEDDAADAAAKKQKEDDDAAAAAARKEEEDAAAKRKEEDDAANAAAKKREEDDAAAKKQKEDDDAAAAAKEAEDNAAAGAEQEAQKEKDRAVIEDDEEPSGRKVVEEEEETEREALGLDKEGDQMKTEAAAAKRRKEEDAEECTYCNEKILDDDYMQGDDLILHGKCVEPWEAENLSKCAQCNKPIKDEYVEYTLNEGKEDAVTVELHEGECIEAYREANLPKCTSCDKSIPDGEGVDVDGMPYHQECADGDGSLRVNMSGGCAHCGKKLEDAEFEHIGEEVVHNLCIAPYCEGKGLVKCKQCDKYIYEVQKDGEMEEKATMVSNLRGGEDAVHSGCVSAWTLGSRPPCKRCDEKILDDDASALNDKLEEDKEHGDLYHTECAEDELGDAEEARQREADAEADRLKPLGECDHCKKDVLKGTKHSTQQQSEEQGGGSILVHAECLEQWKEASLPKCRQCEKPITGDFVEMTLPDTDEVVPLHDGECAEAFQLAAAPRCTHCEKPITGDDGVELGGKPYHDKCADEAQQTQAPPAKGGDDAKGESRGDCIQCGEPVLTTEDSLSVGDEGHLHERCQEAFQAKEREGTVVGPCLHCKEAVHSTEDHMGLPGDEETGEEGGVIHTGCQEDWEKANNPECEHCGKPISGDYVAIKVGEKQCTVHNECAEDFKKSKEEEEGKEEGQDEELEPGDEEYEA